MLLIHGSDDKVSIKHPLETLQDNPDIFQVTSVKASELLHERLPARDKKLSIYQVGYRDIIPVNNSLNYHFHRVAIMNFTMNQMA